MANVLKWNSGALFIKFKNDGYTFWDHTIIVKGAIMDDEVPCFHCGKVIKKGKIAWLAGQGISPTDRGNSGWGSSKQSFCSSNHAKLYAKNAGGL